MTFQTGKTIPRRRQRGRHLRIYHCALHNSGSVVAAAPGAAIRLVDRFKPPIRPIAWNLSPQSVGGPVISTNNGPQFRADTRLNYFNLLDILRDARSELSFWPAQPSKSGRRA
jgi:hypothetical protein